MMDLVRIESIRVIVIDDNQIKYNRLMEVFQAQGHTVNAVLLDDLFSLQKHIKKTWDIIFYSKAYDFDQKELFDLIKNSKQPYLPCLHLEHEDHTQNRYALNSHFFDQVNLNHPKHLLFTFSKAIEVSYLWQEKQRLDRDVENIQHQVKTVAEHMQDASMMVQEGIVIETNQYFKEMFHIDDAFGLPLLDVLQPKDADHFKQQLKLININSAQTYHFEIESINPVLHNKNLSLKIFSDQEQESLHISIGQPQTVQTQEPKPLNYYEQINQIISNQNSTHVEKLFVRLTLDLNEIDRNILSNQNEISQHLNHALKQIKMFFSDDFITAGPFQWVAVLQIDKPLVQITAQLCESFESSSLPFKLSYCVFSGHLHTEDEFYALYAQSHIKITNAVQQHDTPPAQPETATKEQQTLKLVEKEEPITLQVQDTTEHIEPAIIASPPPQIPQMSFEQEESLNERPAFDNDTFTTSSDYQTHVKYQQVYDKNDSNQHIFEVTTVYTDANGISYNLSYDHELPLINTASLIQIDQNSIKAACETLSYFCGMTQTPPDASIVINLHHSSLDSPLAAYLSSILQQTPNLNQNKIILQFNAFDIIHLNLQTHPTWATLKQMNIAIGLRHFNFNNNKIILLNQLQPKICFLALNVEQILSSTTQHQYIQEQFSHFKQIDFVIPELNDMNEFADAWNVDCRYLQGQYFQDKLDHMTNI
ncbi:EAL domain-containing protein [Acinetobacter rathckeae]|uniref:EAL domain-containing protein n=1 Tax=Acinetobacter rathckeae TaxID=2605272 RepID=UPI0018A2BAD6|nr:EAL domain-containing protein [Acinetobacter rathckeae]MBF7687480.1 EAL domain-containing protein [Acinetobacter rathckeae]MBF7694881.1 EAL domain-containing protein [Acinetobacter rathckeae]